MNGEGNTGLDSGSASQQSDPGDSSKSRRLSNHPSSFLTCFLPYLVPSPVLPGAFSIQVKRKIFDYAGVRSGPEWQTITDAYSNTKDFSSRQ